MKYLFVGLSLFLCINTSAWTQKRIPVLQDVFRIQDVDEPELSADGAWVVYSVHCLHPKSNQSSTNIWLTSVDKKQAKALTFAKDYNNFLPKWSPDGQWIAYLSDADGSTQLYLYSIKDHQAKQLTRFRGDISDFSWSPDSNELAFIAEQDNQTGSDEEHAPPIVIDRYYFKDDNEGYLTHTRKHLYLFNRIHQRSTLLTSGEHDEYLPSWSPDGKYIAYVSKRGIDPDRSYNYDIFLIQPHVNHSEHQLTRYRGSDMDPDFESHISWSPDSSRIAYLRGQEGKWAYYAPSQLVVLQIANQEERVVSFMDTWFYKPQWSTDGTALYALVEGNKTMLLHRINPLTGTIQAVTQGIRSDEDFTLAKDKIVLLSSDDTHPSELYLAGTTLTPLTQQNRSLLDEVRFQSAEDFQFKSSDGVVIDGLLMKPYRYSPGEKMPAVLYLHGGPVDQFEHSFDFDLQWFAANGYAVIAPNPRGSSGKGLDFAKAIYADWGHLDVNDALAAIEYQVAQGLIDPHRLAVGGWSYGGILTNYIIARDTRFKAALSGAGSANLLSNYGTDQYTYEYEQELGKPWVKPEVYLKLSYPFLNSGAIKTPTLFMCGQLDFNMPCEGSEQLYQALKSLNIPTQLIIYPHEHHTLEVPSYIADRLKRYVAWLDKYTRS